MAILKVARLGHPVLREKASDLEVKDIKSGKFRPLIEDMIDTMHAYEGVGLAGPQVHLPLRIFVFEVEEKVAKRRGIPKLGAGVFFNATYEPVGREQVLADFILDWYRANAAWVANVKSGDYQHYYERNYAGRAVS